MDCSSEILGEQMTMSHVDAMTSKANVKMNKLEEKHSA